LGSKKGIWPVKTEWWDASMVSCHMARDDLIHDFTAVTFSMKVAFFREKMLISVKSVFFVNFNAFTFIYKGFRV